MLLSLQMVLSLARADCAWEVLERTSALEPSCVMMEPKYLNWLTASRVVLLSFISLLNPFGLYLP